jgi:far upstream element-binding protein
MDPVAQARAVAARLAAAMGSSTPGASESNSSSSVSSSTIPFNMSANPPPADANDPIAKAKAIAARLAANAGLGGPSVLGKRKAEEGEFVWGRGNEDMRKERKKIFLPTNSDVNYIGLLIGPKGSTQKRMEQESGAKLYIRGKGTSKPGDEGEEEDMHVLIIAETPEQLQKAERLVNDLISNPQMAAEVKRQQLRDLASSKSSDNQSASSQNPNTIPLGSQSGGSSDSTNPPPPPSANSYSESFGIPNSFVGLVIGKGGETIRNLQSQTGAVVHVQKESDMPFGSTERIITVTGTVGSVAAAKMSVLHTIETRASGPSASSGSQAHVGIGYHPQHGSSSGSGHQIQTSMIVPDDMVGLIIGRSGATIKGIQGRTGVHIQIPKEADAANPAFRTLQLSASSQVSIDTAQAEIMNVIQNEQANKASGGGDSHSHGLKSGQETGTIPVPNDRVGAIIGKGGVTVKDLQARYAVKIQVPTDPEPGSNPPVRVLSIIGLPHSITAVKQEILTIVSNLQNRFSQAGAIGSGSTGMNPYYGSQAGGQSSLTYASQPYSYPGTSSGYQNISAGYDPYASYQTQQQQPTASTSTADPAADAAAQWTKYFADYYAFYGVYPPEYAQFASGITEPLPPSSEKST